MDWIDLQVALGEKQYIASDELAIALNLAFNLERPLLLEGEAGVGKTEIAKVLSEIRNCRLIRLQCYEGLDASQSIYEWNYQKQLLAIRSTETKTKSKKKFEEIVFSKDFLLERPLLAAISQEISPVLLIDEIDRADQEFEAYLLEILADFQVTIPELGTIVAKSKPYVILTSNGTRDLSDALRRRCLYSYIDYPTRETEIKILKSKYGEIETKLACQIVDFVRKIREEDLEKTPGVAEMLDFAAAIMGLGLADLNSNPKILYMTLITLLKTELDRANITTEIAQKIAGKAA